MSKKAKARGGIFKNLGAALKNHNFRIFIMADACYFMSIAIISAGLLYYVKAMLKLDEAIGTAFMLGLVIITLGFYVLVNYLTPRFSKKKMMVIAFGVAAVVFGQVFFLVAIPFPI